MTTSTFFIPDTSSIFAYSDGWVPAYHDRGDGYDETFHQTSLGSDTVSFNLTASSLHISTPYSDASDPTQVKCDAQYRINGSDWTDGCDIGGMPGGWHAVQVRPKGGGGMQLLGVSGGIRLGDDKNYHNTTIDSLSPKFTYSPSAAGWTNFGASGLIGTAANTTAAKSFTDRSGFFNQSLGMTTVAGATAELKFTGEAVYLYGLGGPNLGSAQLTLDGQLVSMANQTLPWRSYSSLLFMAGGLDGSLEHTLSYTNLIDGRVALIDYAVVTSEGGAKASINLGLILGSAAGGVALALLLCVSLYCCIIRRRSRHRSGTSYRSPYPGSATYTDTPKSVDLWRKHSGGAASPISPVSLAFSDGSRSTKQLIQLHRSPPPDYLGADEPEYIPYNGPIEARPARMESPPPPNIVGAFPSASNWLSAQAVRDWGSASGGNVTARSLTSPSAGTSRSLTSPNVSRGTTSPSNYPTTAGRSPVRPPPPARTGSRDTLGSNVDIPLTALDYYAKSGDSQRGSTVPPSSAVSEAASVRNATIGMASMGRFGAGQGVARLFSATDLSRDSGAATAGSSMVTRQLGRMPDRSRPISSTTFTELYAPRGAHPQPISAGPSTASRRTPSAIPSSAVLTAAPFSPPTPGLRRGVSVKSVKTVRSFFAGLLSGSEAPAVPHHQGAARPDSDLFGDSLSVSRRPSVNDGARSAEGTQGGGAYRQPPQPLQLGQSGGGPRNLFIELNPNSPMTVVSRPGSEQPGW